MAELDNDLLALAVSELDSLPERLNLAVLPQTRIFRRDTALWQDGSSLDARDTGAALNNTTKMGQVPCRVVSILGGVLTQWGELFGS